MHPSAITGVFNDGLIAEEFERYRQDPASVDESWRQYFRFAESLSGGATATASAVGALPAADTISLRKVAAATSLLKAIRDYGHLAVQLDPLGDPAPGSEELAPEFHGLTEADLEAIPAAALGDDRFSTAAEYISHERSVYCGNIGFEVTHIRNPGERKWFSDAFREGTLLRPLTVPEKKSALVRLVETDGLERFLHRTYTAAKRFSVEGTDTLIPMLDEVIDQTARYGADSVVIGMAHRGRLNVLTNIMGKPFAALFSEFEGRHEHTAADVTGDVKYHMGWDGVRVVRGKEVKLRLLPNPSHLEVVNPVVEGVTRALQRIPGGRGARNEASVVAVAVHGDASFPGEGIVTETLNLSQLDAYRTGGTIHIIVNNQVGFTTNPTDGRSTHYSSDPAKGFEMPVFHVCADNAEACIQAVRLACAYREKFRKDVVIDLVGYRRHGHNEGDEPAFTQPVRYAKVRAHPTVAEVWAQRVIADGILSEEDAAAVEKEVMQNYASIQAANKAAALEAPEAHAPWPTPAAASQAITATAVPADRLSAMNEELLTWPSGFTANQRLAKVLERRREAMGPEGGIDWGHAEALAFGTLLQEGVSVRLSGQDAERGTFSHRHAVLSDANDGHKYSPLANLSTSRSTFEVYNSALSETAVLGFEYGFSLEAEDALTLWEGQFGDFANMAQPIIDQFIAADYAKWGESSGLVMLLPHGYEGQGPEHSSARLERYLQLCAEGNMTVAYCSTPAQYFHLLRRQALRHPRRPLICMQPKSLLRLHQAASKLDDLTSGSFHSVLDDPTASLQRDDIRRLVFCSGKIYYDLSMSANRHPHVAIVRVEELYPWPHEAILRIMDMYPAIEQVVWAQEEPRNQGAWTYVQPRLRASAGAAVGVRYIGRPERASPAEGYLDAHQHEQQRIVAAVMDLGDTVDELPPSQRTHQSTQS